MCKKKTQTLRRRSESGSYVMTADDVDRFFRPYLKTKSKARELLHMIGVRFTKDGQFSHVVPI